MTLAEEIAALPEHERHGLAHYVLNARKPDGDGNWMDGFSVSPKRRGWRAKPDGYRKLLIDHGFVSQSGWTLSGSNWYRMNWGVSSDYRRLRRALRDAGVEAEYRHKSGQKNPAR